MSNNNNFKEAKMKVQNQFYRIKLIFYQHSIKIASRQIVHLLDKFKDYPQLM